MFKSRCCKKERLPLGGGIGNFRKEEGGFASRGVSGRTPKKINPFETRKPAGGGKKSRSLGGLEVEKRGKTTSREKNVPTEPRPGKKLRIGGGELEGVEGGGGFKRRETWV